MKNRISIDIDTESEKIIKFNKPADFTVPSTPEEKKKMVDNDIITLTAGLVELITFAHVSGIGILSEYKEFVIKSLNDIES